MALEVARYLDAHDTPLDQIKEAGDWDRVHLLAWRRIVAPPGSVLVTPDVARGARGFTFEPREAVSVKGIDRPVDNLLLR